MSEYVKTKKDIEVIKNNSKYNPVCIYLRNREHFQFNVGDVLIRQYLSYGEEKKWETEKLPNGAVRKYQYAFEDDSGMGYLKMFKADGKLSEVPVPLTEFNLDDSRFQLDPDLADHIMIGDGDFNPMENQNEYKKFRNRAINKNKKLRMETDDIKKIIDWFKTVSDGDTFHRGYTVPDMVNSKYQIVAINLNAKVSDLKDRYDQDRTIREYGVNKYDSWPKLTVRLIKSDRNWGLNKDHEVGPDWFLKSSVTTQEPFPLEDKLCARQK